MSAPTQEQPTHGNNAGLSYIQHRAIKPGDLERGTLTLHGDPVYLLKLAGVFSGLVEVYASKTEPEQTEPRVADTLADPPEIPQTAHMYQIEYLASRHTSDILVVPEYNRAWLHDSLRQQYQAASLQDVSAMYMRSLGIELASE